MLTVRALRRPFFSKDVHVLAKLGLRSEATLMDRVISGDNNISTIRLALALMVLWSHSFAFYYGTEAGEPISVLTRGLYNAGNVGVACFLIMSGALVLRSWEKSAPIDFLIKRLLRLYPAYFVAVFFGAFIVAPIYAGLPLSQVITDHFLKWLLKNIAFNGYAPVDGVFVHSPVKVINGSLWSIFFEVICYIAMTAAVVLFRKGLVPILCSVLVLLTACKMYADGMGWNPGFGIIGKLFGWPYLWFSVGSWFVTGMLFYKLRAHIPRSPAILMLIGVTIASAIWLPQQPIVAKVIVDVLYVPCLAYCLFYLCSSPKRAEEELARRYDLSYGLYLYAFPLQQMILSGFDYHVPFFIYVATAAIVTTAMAFMSWNFIERPAIFSVKHK